MEFNLKRSRIQLYLILGCYGSAVMAAGYTSLPVYVQWLITFFAIAGMLLALYQWWCSPSQLSLRQSKLYVHLDGVEKPPECYVLSTAVISTFWLSVRVRESKSVLVKTTYIFKDSLSGSAWKALCRSAR